MFVCRFFCGHFFFLMIRRPPRSTQGVSSAASDVYKRQVSTQSTWEDDMRSVVEKSFQQIKATGKVKLFKSHKDGFEHGGQLRDFVYVKYAVGAVLAVFFNRAANGIFNVGTGTARSFKDLTLAVYTALDIIPDIEYIDMPIHLRSKYQYYTCLLYTSPSPRDLSTSRMPSSA
eukprot:TRINITY_DN26264_c0_g1_i1.p1 TRINITY_DN26264_c0_g1~~TRINITY_DN26264_c0_g1_i1.p1  ORF type:complete len:173 (-),score=41.21 TRINITY_DN26264_c0_g1_i1:131-649(-)